MAPPRRQSIGRSASKADEKENNIIDKQSAMITKKRTSIGSNVTFPGNESEAKKGTPAKSVPSKRLSIGKSKPLLQRTAPKKEPGLFEVLSPYRSPRFVNRTQFTQQYVSDTFFGGAQSKAQQQKQFDDVRAERDHLCLVIKQVKRTISA